MKVKSNVNTGRNEGAVGSDGVTTYKELRVTVAPSLPADVANKAYVDKVAITDKYLVGDVIIRSTPDTPTGFLRCNGAELDKVVYPDLYAVIGESHGVYTVPGAGTPWRNQYGINNLLNNPLNDWVAGTNLAATNMSFQLAITKNKVYIFGRNNNASTSTSNCYVASITTDGTVGSWNSASVSLPAGLSRAQLFTYLGKLYLIGGHNGTNQSAVYRSTIDSEGNLSAFSTLTALPFTVSDHQCAPIQKRVFLGGGFQNDVASAMIHICEIDANGNFGPWYNYLNNPIIKNFPYPITNHVMTMVNRRGYLIGGLIDGTTATNNVYYSEFDEAGNMTDWKQSSQFPETVYNASVIVTTEKIYVLGGIMNGVYSNKIYFSTIRADGSLGTWSLGGTLPDTISSFRTAVTAGKIYVFGGYKGGSNALNASYYINLPGGLNDYSPYYTGVIGITPTDKFKLPDYSKNQTYKYYFFIKY